MASNRYCIDIAKRGAAGCKNCKSKIVKGLPRIAKVTANPFTDEGGEMKQWYHIRCIFETLTRARATTKKIDSPDDLEGWEDVPQPQKDEVMDLITEFSLSSKNTPKKTTPKTKKAPPSSSEKEKKTTKTDSTMTMNSPGPSGVGPIRTAIPGGKDDFFREFRRLCASLADEPKYNEKTAIVSKFFKKGASGNGFTGDLYLWVKLLLPAVNKRVYNLQGKQIVKLFSQIFDCSQDEMIKDLEQGDVAETVRIFFETSEGCKPLKKSIITLKEIDQYLDELTVNTKEEQQIRLLKAVSKRCTGNDLKTFVRLIKHDLRIGAGPKHVLEALNPTAYQAFQASRDLKDVVERCALQKSDNTKLTVQVNLMTPVLPMLAQACKSIGDAFKKCPNGVLVEIKYDGERVQIHKQGDAFNYFSRSLKPVLAHKVLHLKEYIPKAFPFGNDLILDSEILMVDNTGKPLPFGSLGAHKKAEFQDATVCLFVFDCLRFNDENLMDKPLTERRSILQENMKPITNHVMFSELKVAEDPAELKKMMQSVISQGLEGLLIKDKKSIYEPGKRHWLKIKKDYLDDGAIADSADLVVLGAYFGTGNKGGMMSIFLMGCFDKETKKWCTVTKVHGGHDDATLAKLQNELKMDKISKDSSKVPSWLSVNKPMVPDFVSKNPKMSQVWEITGAEFTKTETHTANGLSIRFPRVTKIRDDKTPKEATTLEELQALYEESKKKTDMVGLSSPMSKRSHDDDDDDEIENDLSDEDANSTNKRLRESPVKIEKSSPPSEKHRSHQSPKKTESTKTGNQSPEKKKSEKTSPIMNNPSSSTNLMKQLPDVFSKVKMFLPTLLDDFETLRRYFIAYDGTLLEEHEKSLASHVVITPQQLSQPGKDFSSSVVKVNVDWLWDSIKLQRRLPEKLYFPTN